MATLLLPLTVGFYDFDPALIANNGSYIRWLEQGRGAWLGESPWPLKRLLDAGLAPVLMRTEIDYLRPLRLGESIALEVRTAGNGGSRWALAMRFVDPEGGADYARAHQEGCFVRVGAGQPVRMPEELRVWMESPPGPP